MQIHNLIDVKKSEIPATIMKDDHTFYEEDVYKITVGHKYENGSINSKFLDELTLNDLQLIKEKIVNILKTE